MNKQTVKGIINDAFSLTNHGNIAQALQLIEPLARSYDRQIAEGLCAATAFTVYYDFTDPISGSLFTRIKNEGRIVYRATEPFARTYSLLGQCYLLSGRIEESFHKLKKALTWDPASPQLYYLLAQACDALGDMNSHDACLESAFPLVTTLNDLAYYQYRHGVRLIEAGKEDRGIANLQMSIRWNNTEAARAALMDAAERFGVQRVRMDQSTVTGVMIAGGDPIFPREETTQMLIDFATEAATREDFAYAHACLSRVLAYAPDDNLREMDKNLQRLMATQADKGVTE